MTRLSPTKILRDGLRVLLPLSVALTVYLYLFPVFSSCAFPLPPSPGTSAADTGRSAFLETTRLHWPFAAASDDASSSDAAVTSSNQSVTTPTVAPARRRLAPLRLLALGDPQLEGDTSIPTDYLGVFPHVKSLAQHLTFRSEQPSLRHRIKQSLHDIIDIFLEDTFNLAESLRKRIDLFGNDFYLAHIYRTVHWWTRPSHVTVLGDLVGSQWLTDDEFDRRADRFWTRVFRGSERVPDDVAATPSMEYDLAGFLGGAPINESDPWPRRIINVAGNHDIGYAGDINENRTERFERAFGRLNYELRFELPLDLLNLSAEAAAAVHDDDDNPQSTQLPPEVRIVVLNDMNLDTPAVTPKLQEETYAFINNVINTAAAVEYDGHYTIILTHIPLYKPEGVCVDDPLFNFHDHDGTLKEQNQLSLPASKGFLEGLLGKSGDVNAAGRGRGRPGIILNGHDHEGCDTWHYINQTVTEADKREWEVRRWRQAQTTGVVGRPELPGVREITVRSMMGDFGGNAGLLSVWFDDEAWEWRAEYAVCPLGRQHLWWLVHILDLFAIVGVLLWAVLAAFAAAGVDVDGLICRGVMSMVPGSMKTGVSKPAVVVVAGVKTPPVAAKTEEKTG